MSDKTDTYNTLTYPGSISLLQFCFGVLLEKEMITLPLSGYVPLVTVLTHGNERIFLGLSEDEVAEGVRGDRHPAKTKGL